MVGVLRKNTKNTDMSEFVFLFQFIKGASDICEALNNSGFWADFIDPSCGRPVSIQKSLQSHPPFLWETSKYTQIITVSSTLPVGDQ
jgi:hypothetical protein